MAVTVRKNRRERRVKRKIGKTRKINERTHREKEFECLPAYRKTKFCINVT